MKRAKRTVSGMLAVVIILLSLCMPAFSVKNSYNGVTSAATPSSPAELKFVKKLGEGYTFAPTAPVVTGGVIVVMSGKKLYKLNAKNGSELASAPMAGNNTYTVVSPCVANGMIFVPLNDGRIQAFDFETLKPLWLYTDPLGGQSLCNIVYNSGCIYTGFWNGDAKSANFVCISVNDENPALENEAKRAKWAYSSKGGFYLTDACITSRYVIVGTDNGKEDSSSNSKVIALGKANGKPVSSLAVKGDVRSAVIYDSGTKRYFVVTKAGYLYSFAMDSSSGALSSKKSLALCGAATAAPVIHKGRLYVGASDGTGGGRFYVVNASLMKKIYSFTVGGYPQASPLVSTAYESDGKIYVYFTVNAKPGAIYYFEDSKGAKSASASVLYAPSEQYSQFCLSRIAAGDDGTLYYKNDSGAIFAVGAKSGNFITGFINNILAFILKILGR